MCKALATCYLFAALATPVAAADLPELVDNIVEAYGGVEAVKKTASFRIEATVNALMRNLDGTVRRDFKAPDRYRVEIRYGDVTELRILDGKDGWRGDLSMLQKVSGLPYTAMAYQMYRGTIPWVLLENKSLLEDRGSAEHNGRSHFIVGLRVSEELDLSFWVDGKTLLIDRVEGILASKEGPEMRFRTDYEDMRAVQGLLIPHVENTFAGGTHTGTMHITGVEFAPPDLGPFDPRRSRP